MKNNNKPNFKKNFIKKHLINILQKIILTATKTKIYRQKPGARDYFEKEYIIKKDVSKNKKSKTVVMISDGDNFFLKHNFAQAKKVLSNANFVLIGNHKNQEHANSLNIDFYPIEDFSEGIEYKYMHLSPNPQKYEKFCIDRWIILCNFVNKMNLRGALYFDADVFVLDNLIINVMCNHKYDIIKQKENIDFTWPCAIYWSKKSLNMFVRYIKLIYGQNDENKALILKEIMNRFKKKGISDMTLISDFCLENSTVKRFIPYFEEFYNSNELNINQIKFDDVVEFKDKLIWLDSKFEGLLGKRIVYKKGNFLCNDARVLYIHFQGPSKGVFRRFIQQVENKKSFIITRDAYIKNHSYTLYSLNNTGNFLKNITNNVIKWGSRKF
ncbi:hypothetical protein KY334_07270 [Candidatus Woesearchaeota archaeon]|nr:hypothetical protein [Candidatus Woesearchaeota archaeon]